MFTTRPLLDLLQSIRLSLSNLGALSASVAAIATSQKQQLVMLQSLLDQGKALMSGLTDLQAAEASLGTSVAAAIADIASLSAKLSTAVAGDDDSAVEAAAQDIATKIAALNAAVNPPAAVAPVAPAAATEAVKS